MERNGRRAAVVQTLDLPPRRPAECRWGNARKLQPDGGAYDRTKNRRLCLPIGAGQGEAGQPGDPRIAQAAGGGISTPACLVPGGQSRHGAGREYGSAGRAGVDFGTRQKLANSAGWCARHSVHLILLLRWVRVPPTGGCKSRPAGLPNLSGLLTPSAGRCSPAHPDQCRETGRVTARRDGQRGHGARGRQRETPIRHHAPPKWRKGSIYHLVEK